MTYYTRRSTIRVVLLVLFLLFYLILGAIVFSLIEGPLERNLKQQIRDNWFKFLDDNKCLSSKFYLIERKTAFFCCVNFVGNSLYMVPTWTEKMGEHFPVREKSGNFYQNTGKLKKYTGKVREICQPVIVKTLQIWYHTLN